MSVISPIPCRMCAPGTTRIARMIICGTGLRRKSGAGSMCSRFTHGPRGVSNDRSQADESAGEERRAEQVLSVQMADTSAWNEREEHKEEVEPEESRSEASRKQSAMRR